MNHIHRLQNENDTMRKQLAEARQAIIDFRVHLNSAKFHVDTTIQVSDVHNRLDNIVAEL